MPETIQADLFTPATRNTDPETSHIAGKKITESGERAEHCKRILLMMRKYNGYTTAELAGEMSLTEAQVHKRMHELNEYMLMVTNKDPKHWFAGKYIMRGSKRKCKVKGSFCSPWWIL